MHERPSADCRAGAAKYSLVCTERLLRSLCCATNNHHSTGCLSVRLIAGLGLGEAGCLCALKLLSRGHVRQPKLLSALQPKYNGQLAPAAALTSSCQNAGLVGQGAGRLCALKLLRSSHVDLPSVTDSPQQIMTSKVTSSHLAMQAEQVYVLHCRAGGARDWLPVRAEAGQERPHKAFLPAGSFTWSI